MVRKKTSRVLPMIAIMLVITLLLPISASASDADITQSRASHYLSYYNAYAYPAGAGLIQVYFNASGGGYLDELGALSIQIYECSTNSSDIDDWTWKTTFTHDSTPGMLSYNDNYHSGHVDYYGTAGKYYKAYVCIWGGKNGDGDTRYFWTSAKKAT